MRVPSLLLVCATTLLLAASGVARAAHAMPPQMADSTPEEQTRYIQEAAEESLRQKLAVGKQRTEMREQFRQQLVAGMRSHAESRASQIMGDPTPVQPGVQAAQREGHRLVLWLCLLGGCLAGGWLALRRVSRSAEDSSLSA